MANQWFVKCQDQELGPLSSGQFKMMAAEGRLGPDDAVRLGQDGRWVTARQVKGLLFRGAQPAPITPPIAEATSSPPPLPSLPCGGVPVPQITATANTPREAPIPYDDPGPMSPEDGGRCVVGTSEPAPLPEIAAGRRRVVSVLRGLWNEAMAVAVATIAHAYRLIRYGVAVVRRHTLATSLREAQLTLGERMCQEAFGDKDVLAQIRDLDAQIIQVRDAKQPASLLLCRRRQLQITLARSASDAISAKHKVMECGLALDLQQKLHLHETKLQANRARLLPVDVAEWSRIAIGYGAAGLLVIVGLTMFTSGGTRETAERGPRQEDVETRSLAMMDFVGRETDDDVKSIEIHPDRTTETSGDVERIAQPVATPPLQPESVLPTKAAAPSRSAQQIAGTADLVSSPSELSTSAPAVSQIPRETAGKLSFSRDALQDIARQLLQMASDEAQTVKLEDRPDIQRKIARTFARLGDLDGATKAGLGEDPDPLPQLIAAVARGELERAKQKARSIAHDSAHWRADAFLEIADLLARTSDRKAAAATLREAFWDSEGRPVEPAGSIHRPWYDEHVARVQSRLVDLQDWEGARRCRISDAIVAPNALRAGALEVAADAVSEWRLWDDAGTSEEQRRLRLDVAVKVVHALAAAGKRDKVRAVCQKVAQDLAYGLNQEPEGTFTERKRDVEYGADMSLLPLVELAAIHVGVELVEQITAVHHDESVQVQALVRAAIACHKFKDEKGRDLLMRKAKAQASQCTASVDEIDARSYVASGLILVGDSTGAEEYARLCKERGEHIGETVSAAIASAEQSAKEEATNQVNVGSARPSDAERLSLVQRLSAGKDPAKAFQQAALIGDQERIYRLYAYLHLVAVAPESAEWNEVRRAYKGRAETAATEPDPMVRLWRLGEVCQLQIAVFGIGDPDVKKTLEAIGGTELPTLALDAGTLYLLDPKANSRFKDAEISTIFAWGARGEIARGRDVLPHPALPLLHGLMAE